MIFCHGLFTVGTSRLANREFGDFPVDSVSDQAARDSQYKDGGQKYFPCIFHQIEHKS